MEFNEKLQSLRREKGLTQEELARALYVSRTAISKWESGRGYPSIDSIKAIAVFFGVSVDELLLPREALGIAEEVESRKEKYFRDLVFGLLDISTVILLFLPFFAEEKGDFIQAVSLVALDGVQPYLKVAYLACVIGMAIMGVLTLALQNWQSSGWVKAKLWISLGLGTLTVVLFIVSSQSYAAIFAFVLLVIKALMLVKKR